jgi:serine/threonine protein kinase
VEEGPEYSCLIMKRLGISVDDAFMNQNKRFDLRTFESVCLQMLDRIKLVHSCGYIHCDIEPDNFLFGRKTDSQTVYIIDFGLSKKYPQENDDQCVDFEHTFVGSLRFASVNAHQGHRLSRRDDMESFCYMIMYLANGSLPWQDINCNESERTSQVETQKCQKFELP